MTDTIAPTAAAADYGIVTEAGAIRFERLLPGPIERVWAYLTQADKRAEWLADGPMDLTPGGPMELIWRNQELAQPDEVVPAKYADQGEMRMKGKILRAEPPHLLVHSWGERGSEVAYELAEAGDKVRLTLTHRRLPDREAMTNVGGGWHTHLDVLRARLEDGAPIRFWESVTRLQDEYGGRLPAQ